MRRLPFSKLILFLSCLAVCMDRPHSQTVTDIDGNVYPAVQIGAQVWMAENLRTTRFRDGRNIPEIPDSVQWCGGTIPGYCWYANAVAYKDVFGALYNWPAASSGKLAPEGWHVATDQDWSILVDNLGGAQFAGGKLKALGSIDVGDGYWYTPNEGATNESGFSALAGGAREYNGGFHYIFSHGYFWTSTAGNTGMAVFRKLFYNSTDVDSGSLNQPTGMSVRCVRDSVVGGTDNNPAGKIKIYSIPGTGRIVVYGMAGCPCSLSVYDLAGRLAFTGNPYAASRIDPTPNPSPAGERSLCQAAAIYADTGLHAGIYIVQVSDRELRLWRKVMVQ